MNRHTVNRVSGIAPVVLSLAAFAVAMVAALTGWDRGNPDEASAAHIFGLLIVAQVPCVLVFAASADWKRLGRVTGLLGLQVSALILAFAPVALFRL